MSTAVRQRVPFRFSEDGEDDGRILDEQEQEEVIGRLRKENEDSNAAYHIALQIVIGLSFIIHVLFLFSGSKLSPLANVLPGPPPTAAVPFATALTLLQLLIHLNLSLYSLPPKHRYRHLVPHAALPRSLELPLPLAHPISIILTIVAPTYALLLGRGYADVIWWAVPGALTGLVALVKKWMRDGEKDVAELEKLRYTARGA
ncbi:hypothetical protein C8Q80DRAFT_1142322 [Daedaleopsis nitida]|nr:hypothetical protein C8Q80DRAFT_1142322 [Daedaleopsis nitida]